MKAVSMFVTGKRLTRRHAFTLVELLVTIGIIGILIGMLLPGVQAVREAARRSSCQNKMRQIALAAHQFESAHQQLPSPSFNSHPNSTNYRSDSGLFVQLLPHMEQENRRFRSGETTFALENSSAFESVPALFICPSAEPPIRLTEIASRFSGPPEQGLESLTCDYIGNAGYVSTAPVPTYRKRGPIGLVITSTSNRSREFADVRDGASNTVVFWESAGASIKFPGVEAELNPNDGIFETFTITINSESNQSVTSLGFASTKSYLFAWPGLRLGNVVEHESSVINVGNTSGQPYSLHPGGCSFARLDGSVDFMNENTAPDVLNALASSSGGETSFDL